jgi:hypothetical protein
MITMIQRIECDFCGAVEVVSSQTLVLPWTPICFTIPTNWRVVGDKMACSRHDVVVKDLPQAKAKA